MWGDPSQGSVRAGASLSLRCGSRPGCGGGEDRASQSVWTWAGTRPSGHKRAGCRVAVPRSRLQKRAELSRDLRTDMSNDLEQLALTAGEALVPPGWRAAVIDIMHQDVRRVMVIGAADV